MKHKLHSHPVLEKRLNVPNDHVIIDHDVFEEIRDLHYKYQFPEFIINNPKMTFGTEENRKMLNLAFSMLLFKIENEPLDEIIFDEKEDKLLRSALKSLRKHETEKKERRMEKNEKDEKTSERSDTEIIREGEDD